ncbi:ferric reductase like transmembrane component [Xylariomycetidae sp. FL0641]|nr:ferric reductase like transmembrane component [Xylariomycetidae sp. FL0641]
MAWPYQFLDLSDAEKHARRQSLDRHAAIAQASSLLPLAILFIYRLGRNLIGKRSTSARGAYSAVPSSPTLKQRRLGSLGAWTSGWRKATWWLGDDVVFLGQDWGQRDQLIAGFLWTLWLLFLCVEGTGNDYLHLTKRFGIVGISQFPVQYLLALKNINPIAFALDSSHEQVNRWHRVLGRITYVLLVLHGAFYLNFYVQQGILLQKLTYLVPALGLASLIGMHLLNATALKFMRQYSYRLFFITHLMVALALPPAIYFHAHHSKYYVAEAMLVFVADFAKRKFDTVTAETSLELIPGTDLIKMVAQIPPTVASRYQESPGSHVYINIPAASRITRNPIAPGHLIFEFVYNPFSVAAVDEELGQLTLVARHHGGPMTRSLLQYANDEASNKRIPLAIEGPYGCATRFPSLAGPDFDRVLLVAGGVGATFILPLYRAILSENPTARVKMAWAVRDAGDATWAVSENEKSILEDDNVDLYLTGGFENDDDGASGEGTELRSMSKVPKPGSHAAAQSHRRPDLQHIVDNTFKHSAEDRVAVLVCGPDAMVRDLRSCVGKWARKGRHVWWHDESFAW